MINTKVYQKYFGEHATNVSSISNGEHYIYKITCKKHNYIVKGFQIKLDHLDSDCIDIKNDFGKTLNAIKNIFEEYYVSKFIPIFNQHIAKALEIDTNIVVPSDKNGIYYLYIEILFEYAGKELSEKLEIDKAYDLMRQSATALTLLNNSRITHLDIKPENMVYNEDTGILKLIDMGSAYNHSSTTELYKDVKLEDRINNPIRSFTFEYSAPELLKYIKSKRERMYMDINEEEDKKFYFKSEMVIAGLDSYCWGMSFYKLLLDKSIKVLRDENERYKLGTEENYANFIHIAKKDINKVLIVKNKDQNYKAKLIKKYLFKALEYNPTKRILMSNILNEMKECEEKYLIKTNYQRIETTNMKV